MKTLRFLLIIVVLAAVSGTLSAQGTSKATGAQTTQTFKVWGNCDMCKERIENTVKAEGAISASWDVKTKMLTVAFDPAKTSVDALDKKLAAVGHDTEKYKADDKAYAALPMCCKYERRK
jgi:periplasmic mercuric ion binding protein